MMNHYVVTGGAGFIGSAIVRKLLDEGARSIVVIDNLLTGRERNLEEIRSRIDFQRADIRNYEEIAPLIRGARVVFHEAAIPSVPRSIDDPVPSHDVNANGTFNVLRAAKEGQAGRVVYAASSSAYGDTDVLPKVESMTPRPKSPYALQKLMGEYYANIFSGVYGLETVSLRYFNVYGPRQDPSSAYSGVLSLFMTAVLDRKAPTIFGDGEHSRDFTFVEDVAELNLKAARAKGVSGNVYNGGNGGRITSTRRGRCSRNWKASPSRPSTDRRARATCAIPRPTPRSPSAIWATPRATGSRKACGSRWSGTATTDDSPGRTARGIRPRPDRHRQALGLRQSGGARRTPGAHAAGASLRARRALFRYRALLRRQ